MMSIYAAVDILRWYGTNRLRIHTTEAPIKQRRNDESASTMILSMFESGRAAIVGHSGEVCIFMNQPNKEKLIYSHCGPCLKIYSQTWKKASAILATLR